MRDKELNVGRKKRREWVWKAFQLRRRLLKATKKYDLREQKKINPSLFTVQKFGSSSKFYTKPTMKPTYTSLLLSIL
jgi:hypothetical protein